MTNGSYMHEEAGKNRNVRMSRAMSNEQLFSYGLGCEKHISQRKKTRPRNLDYANSFSFLRDGHIQEGAGS